jgi:hypothetical protein
MRLARTFGKQGAALSRIGGPSLFRFVAEKTVVGTSDQDLLGRRFAPNEQSPAKGMRKKRAKFIFNINFKFNFKNFNPITSPQPQAIETYGRRAAAAPNALRAEFL